MPSRQSLAPSWIQTILDVQTDCVAWIYEELLDPSLLAEYRKTIQAAGIAIAVEKAIRGGEHVKAWNAVPTFFNLFQNAGLTRHSLVLTTGGGALSDAAGFAASTWKRGMKVVHIPTTTLAAIDAAWGGKTGVNWEGSKNQIGTFFKPLHVHVDARWMQSLPEREFRAGLAEAAKHAMIRPEAPLVPTPSWSRLLAGAEDEVERWNRWLTKSASVKMLVVAEDPEELGVRTVLNLGHTVGHALESASLNEPANRLLHGEAVALGLAFAIFESKLGILSAQRLNSKGEKEATVIMSWLKESVPLTVECFPEAEHLWNQMIHDKKNVGNEVRDVAWRGVGNVVWPVTWEKEVFEATWIDFVRFWKEQPNVFKHE